jgi:hypothetical protein
MTFDPDSCSASSWKARLAALSRSVPDDDPRLVECRAALACHRFRRQVDSMVAEGHMTQSLADAFLTKLREYSADELAKLAEPEPVIASAGSDSVDENAIAASDSAEPPTAPRGEEPVDGCSCPTTSPLAVTHDLREAVSDPQSPEHRSAASAVHVDQEQADSVRHAPETQAVTA